MGLGSYDVPGGYRTTVKLFGFGFVISRSAVRLRSPAFEYHFVLQDIGASWSHSLRRLDWAR